MQAPRPLAIAAAVACLLGACTEATPAPRPNVLLIVADDLGYESLGVTGNPAPDVSPHLDRFAGEGLLLARAHVNVAVCLPSRQVLMTGRYPHRSADGGFGPLREGVPTLTERLRAAGYRNGILAKVSHLSPVERYCWDEIVTNTQLGNGRDVDLYHRHTTEFLAHAEAEGRPFFLMVNTRDPHRPFAGSPSESRRRATGQGLFPYAERLYTPSEVRVPSFLPDLPGIRREIAEYTSSVHRMDAVVGAVLAALAASGHERDTLVLFLSDHGMAMPFAKANCYLQSTRTPLIARWPGRVPAGAVDDAHLVAALDLAPTLLDALGLAPLDGADGRSFLPVLLGGRQEGRDRVFTQLDRSPPKREPLPMRAVVGPRLAYIFNAWSDGLREYDTSDTLGRGWTALQLAARDDPQLAARSRHFLLRTPEELYDWQLDPDSLQNLAGDPARRADLVQARAELLDHLRATGDPLLPAFEAHLARE